MNTTTETAQAFAHVNQQVVNGTLGEAALNTAWLKLVRECADSPQVALTWAVEAVRSRQPN